MNFLSTEFTNWTRIQKKWYHQGWYCIYWVYTILQSGDMMESGKNFIPSRGVIVVTTTVQKWGNSLAVRIPSKIAESLLIDQGSEVVMSVENQVLTLKAKKQKPSLDELLSRITVKNRHYEFDFGRTEGNEQL